MHVHNSPVVVDSKVDKVFSTQVIPIYGRGQVSDNRRTTEGKKLPESNDSSIPPRPAGQRIPPVTVSHPKLRTDLQSSVRIVLRAARPLINGSQFIKV